MGNGGMAGGGGRGWSRSGGGHYGSGGGAGGGAGRGGRGGRGGGREPETLPAVYSVHKGEVVKVGGLAWVGSRHGGGGREEGRRKIDMYVRRKLGTECSVVHSFVCVLTF